MIQTTMQDGPLLISDLVEYSRKVFQESTVSTWTGTSLRTESFPEIGDKTARIANALNGLGIKIGDRVGTFMWNNNEHQALYGAVPAMGAVLHTVNLRLSAEQAVYVMNHAEDKVVFVDASVAPLLSQYLSETTTITDVIVCNGPTESLQAPEKITVHAFDEFIAGQPTTYDWPAIDERAAAAMCYTSGTTGNPKGVVYSHRSIYLHSMQVNAASAMGLTGADTSLVIVPMFHAMSWGMPYAAMMCGASMVNPDRFLQPEPLLALMAATKPTMAAAVPTIWTAVGQQLDATPQDISHLNTVVVGGAALPEALIRKFDAQGVTLKQAWGMTETSPIGSCAAVPAGVEDEDKIMAYRVSQGRLVPPVKARIVDPDGKQLPWDGEAAGELEVSGPWITGSYYDPAGNVSAPDKFDDGWLRTGDVATITPDGFLSLVDRTKDIIKTGGEWISSVDLENTIIGHPDVAECTVIGVPDPKWDERPFVLAVPRAGATLDVDEMRSWLEERIPRWQVPERWSFGEEVPKTSVGKYDKKVVRQQYADGLFEVINAVTE